MYVRILIKLLLLSVLTTLAVGCGNGRATKERQPPSVVDPGDPITNEPSLSPLSHPNIIVDFDLILGIPRFIVSFEETNADYLAYRNLAHPGYRVSLSSSAGLNLTHDFASNENSSHQNTSPLSYDMDQVLPDKLILGTACIIDPENSTDVLHETCAAFSLDPTNCEAEGWCAIP